MSALILSVNPDCPLLLVLVEAWPYSKDKVFNCLTFLLLVAILANTNICKMMESLAYGYLFESTQRELSNEYGHDKVYMVFKKSLL